MKAKEDPISRLLKITFEMCEIDPSEFGRDYEMQDYRKSTKNDYG